MVERRDYARYDTDVPAMVTSPNMRLSVRMLSVSAGGALVRMDRLSSKVFEDDTFTLEISGVGRFKANKKWRRDTDLGCKFDVSDKDRMRLADRLEHQFGRAGPQIQPAAANAGHP
ncbi:MAG: PilZ domain-containing protein [Pseudorhodobacter sp.]|nr:PilZ domain-containing protein [Pseudorhodobacter sp.]